MPRDKDGRALDGGRTYRLNVPANAPGTEAQSLEPAGFRRVRC
jgi:hypothetical protein